jgi:putative transferase (TIGR04331 family)
MTASSIQEPYFLVTTDFVESWPQGKKLLFIDQQLLTPLKSKNIAEYELIDNALEDEFVKTEKNHFTTALSRKLLPCVTSYLNELHKTDHDIPYWTLCINLWLTNFVDVLLQRWDMTTAIGVSPHTIRYRVYPVNQNLICPNTSRDLVKLSQSAAWNHHMFAEILNERNLATIEVADSAIDWSSEVLTHQNSKIIQSTKGAIYKFLQKRVARFSESIISATYLPRKSEWLLAFKLRSLPIRWFEPSIDHTNIDFDFRNSVKLTGISSSEFETFIRKLLPLHLPRAVVENFKEINHQIVAMNLPKIPKVIFTSNLHNSSDTFAIWAARCQQSGTRIVIGQHGGLFGQTSPPTRNEFQELAIADKYLSWGWDDGAPNLVRGPTFITLGAKQLRRLSVPTDLVLITDGLYKYSRRPWSTSTENTLYLSNLFDFVHQLPVSIQSSLLVRLYKGHEHFDSKQVARWTEFEEQIRVDNGEQPIQNLRKNAKLIICTTLGTSEVEQFYSKIPTVIFLDLKIVHLRQSMIPVFKLLEQAGAVHYSVESLVNHITSVWDDVDSWWNMPKTQEAVSNFQSKFAQQIPDGLRFIVNEIATDD